MRKLYTFLALGLLGGSFLSSCKKDDSSEIKLDVPATYEFQRNGQSTVDFNGQVQRQSMLKEIATYMSTATSGAVLDVNKLINMYENTNAPFADAALNTATTKKLSDKTSASATHVANQGPTINWFKSLLQGAAAASANSVAAAKGQAGVIGTDKKYLVNEKGVEYAQLLQKGLMGACFMDQAVNNYLSDAKLNVDNETLEAGKNYTKMEHHWDEAFGYFSKIADFKLDGDQDRGYWGGYIKGLEVNFKIASTIYNAYRTGRAAIVAKNYAERDKQRDIIRAKFEEACVIKAVHYLGEFKEELAAGNTAVAFHELSEGLGFVYSLRYAASGKVSIAKSEAWVNKLTEGDGFWSADITTKVDAVRAEIIALYKLDPAKEY